MSWYALFVKTGYESSIKRWLDTRFDNNLLHSVIPKRKVPEKKDRNVQPVIKTLFPGYVFVETKMSFSIYYTLKENPFIYNTLNYLNNKDKKSILPDAQVLSVTSERPEESHFFKEIPSEEMHVVLKLINENEVIEYSQVYFQDSHVIVQSGPLKGMESLIKKVDKHKKRAKVLMNIMGREQLVDFGIEILE
ncbi:transcription termination/antitermination protein NusG [Paenibacillus sp. JCM 10914]|uniref:antiterminator LoaP n=1 Tax=Paenibacillus sp. JCM 10914 TaxID=1236974 RepID=UPI0003CC4843|nr:antiterminator LoaP [Paenibacillus sp. JCM 10914]GAE05089.1 transcription antitermination protein NusG [Paenibacillus sp. JCM 10914]